MSLFALGIIAVLFIGLLGYVLGYRRFLIEEKFRDKKHKVDELRSFLGGTAEDLVAIVNIPFDREGLNQDQHEELRIEIRTIHAETDRLRPLFVDDEEMIRALAFMGDFTAMRLETDNLPIEPFERFISFRSLLFDRLSQMEKELYEPLNWKFWT